MKKLFLGFILGLLVGALGYVYADDVEQFVATVADFPVLVNGQEFKSDKPIVVIDGSTYMPLRAIGDALGTKVVWNNDSHRVEVGEAPISNSDSKWNKADINTLTNGNLPLAINFLKNIGTEDLKQKSISIDETSAFKAPWNFFGELVKVDGEVLSIQEYPKESNVSKTWGIGEVGEMSIKTNNAVFIDYINIEPAQYINVGDNVTIYGYITGNIEGTNKLGGKTTNLSFVGKCVSKNDLSEAKATPIPAPAPTPTPAPVPLKEVKLFEDDKVKISFISADASQVGFIVENKTDLEVTIQADSLAINGIGADGYIGMSEDVAPKSKQKAYAKCATNLNGDVKTISGQLRVIDFSRSWDPYAAKFVNVEIK